MKATEVIKRDHRAAEELFERYKQATAEDREMIAEEIFAALDAHEAMEDEYFYPALKGKIAEDDETFAELEQEQDELAAMVEDVRGLSGDRDQEMQEMMEAVLAHARKEEREILPAAEELFEEDEMRELGAEMEPVSAAALSAESEEEEEA